MRVIIKNLFDKQNFDLQFDNKLNVMIGENGCGKTTIIKMISNLINRDYIGLLNYSFESIEIQDEYEVVVNKKDIIPLPFSTNYDFRPFIFGLDYNLFNSFDDYFDYVFDKANGFYNYPSKTNYKENYVIDVTRYLADDNNYVEDEKYLNYMNQAKIPYGSKMYLRYVYSFYKNEIPLKELQKIAQQVYFHSFIDIRESNDVNLLKYNDKKMQLLSKYLKDKILLKKDDYICISDATTKDEISYLQLSSGERKIIKLIDVVLSATENSFLLLDEPELSLSIYWQRMLIEDLMDNCLAKKIIITTQSTSLLMEDEIEMLVPLFVDYDGDLDEMFF